MAAFTAKLVLKGSTGVSLHDRFSQLRKLPEPEERPQFYEPAPLLPSPHPEPRQLYYEPPVQRPTYRRPRAYSVVPAQRENYVELYEAGPRNRLGSMRGRGARAVSEFNGSARRARNLAFEAAMKIKQRSIKQRLGVRRNNFSFDDEYLFGGVNHNHQFKRYRIRGRRGRGGGRGGGGGRGRFRGMRRTQSYGKIVRSLGSTS